VSWFLAFAGFAALIVLHELGHFAAAKAVGMRVERFALFFPPLIGRVRRGETEYAIGAVPLGGYVKITGMNPAEEIPPEHAHRAYYRQPVWKRIFVILAGPVMNLIIAFLILWVLFLDGGRIEATQDVTRLESDYPAARVLQEGDRLVSVDGRTGDLSVLSPQIATHRCEGEPRDGCRAATPAEVVVEREGRRREFEIRPIYDAELGRTRLGFSTGREVEVGATGAAEASVTAMWRVSTATMETLARIFDAERRREISGVVGGYETTRQSFNIDTRQALNVLAIISLSLAIINLFPFLPLDGGHIFWAIVEKLRGRAVPFAIMERSGLVGFMLVIMLFLVGFTNDLDRLQNEGFRPR
jgi:regulator of sigma E protease